MSRTNARVPARRGRRAATGAEAALDEACFLAELRLTVEGARTAAEERLAQAFPGWRDRLDRVCARLGR